MLPVRVLAPDQWLLTLPFPNDLAFLGHLVKVLPGSAGLTVGSIGPPVVAIRILGVTVVVGWVLRVATTTTCSVVVRLLVVALGVGEDVRVGGP